MDFPGACTAPLRAIQLRGLTPSNFAPSSITAMRPAAPARLRTGKLCQTDQLAPVIIRPHFGSESTPTMRTLDQSASNSSATIRASEVPTCCPISARMMLIVTSPLRSMPYQIVGSNSSPALPGCLGCERIKSGMDKPDRAYPSMTPAPISVIRNLRRDGSTPDLIPCGDRLSMRVSFSHPVSCHFDRLADSQIRHAATEAAGHNRINVLVSRIGEVLEQRGSLHDLSRLAITALRDLQFQPCKLQRMLPFGIKSFDGGHISACHRAHSGDAGTGCPPVHMHGAGAAQTDPATEFGSFEPKFVTDQPEQRLIFSALHRNISTIELECSHRRRRPLFSTATSPSVAGPLLLSCPSQSTAAVWCACAADKLPASPRPRRKTTRRTRA